MSVRLVIAEDTEHLRRMLVDILGLHGFEVVAEARTGDEALRRVDENVPDVVVVGHSPHGLDGIEATRRIRGHGLNPQVILYSASIDGEIEGRAKDAGAATCVSRTAGIEALAREITAITFCMER
jgi:DNA-binding NarL/FixJ family response regulator